MSDSPQVGRTRRQYKAGDWIAGEYHVLNVFGGSGRSGQGVVYLVEEREAPEPFVLKTFQADQEAAGKARLSREAEVWVSLGFHPYIVPAFWVRELDDQLFVAAEFVCPDAEGRSTLTDYIADGPLPQAVISRWAVQFCDGLEYAVAKGLRAHRDIKPDNLMVGSDYELRITDFGLADLSAHGREIVGGTLLYMAPEQFVMPDRVDYRADIYAFGIVLFQLITGGGYPYSLPQHVDNPALTLARIHVEQAPMRAPGEFAEVVLRCMSKRPAERPTISELRSLIQGTAARLGIQIPDRLASVRSRSDEALYAEAQSFSALGKPERALSAIREYTTRYPDRACGWTEASRFFLETGDAKNAVAAALESLKRDSTNSHGWNNLGVAFQRLDEMQQSIDAFRSAIKCDPYNTGSMMQLAGLLAQAGQKEEPTEILVRALDLRPQKETLRFNAGNAAAIILQNGGVEEGRRLLEKLVRLEPNNSIYWFNLGLAHQSAKRPSEAIRCFRRAVALKPDDGFAWMSLARLLAERGEFEEAIKCCEGCPADSAEYWKAVPFKAQLLAAKGSYAESVEFLEKAIKDNPRDDQLLFVLAVIHQRQGRMNESLDCAERCRLLLKSKGETRSENFQLATELVSHLRAQRHL